MGTTRMANTTEVEKRIPGLRFQVVSSEVMARSTSTFNRVGYVKLRCEFSDRQLWELALDRFKDLKIFSGTTEELLGALGDELNSTDAQLKQARARESALLKELEKQREEVAKLRSTLAEIGVQLGIE